MGREVFCDYLEIEATVAGMTAAELIHLSEPEPARAEVKRCLK